MAFWRHHPKKAVLDMTQEFAHTLTVYIARKWPEMDIWETVGLLKQVTERFENKLKKKIDEKIHEQRLIIVQTKLSDFMKRE